MKKLAIMGFAAVLAMLITAPAHAIKLKKKNALACEAILCAVGIAIPASHSECRKVLTEWSIYLATLGPFTSKPKCPRIDKNEVIISWEEMKCSSIQDADLRKICEDAEGSGTGGGSCTDLSDPKDIIECECGRPTGEIKPEYENMCK